MTCENAFRNVFFFRLTAGHLWVIAYNSGRPNTRLGVGYTSNLGVNSCFSQICFYISNHSTFSHHGLFPKEPFSRYFSLLLQGSTMHQNTSNSWATLAKRPFVVNPTFVKFDGNLLNLCEICSNCDEIHTYTSISFVIFGEIPSNFG